MSDETVLTCGTCSSGDRRTLSGVWNGARHADSQNSVCRCWSWIAAEGDTGGFWVAAL